MRRSILIYSYFCALYASTAMATPMDQREYADWSAPEYAAFVKIGSSAGTFCTGQFIAPDLIITNAHCTQSVDCKTPGICHITTYDGTSHPVVYVDGGEYKRTIFTQDTATYFDYAFLKISDDGYKSADYFPVYDKYYTGNVFNAGFGSLRVLSDDEIKQVRQTYIELLSDNDFADMQKRNPTISYEDYKLMQQLNNMDATYREQPITKEHFQSLDDALAAKGIPPIFQDVEKFKVHKNCQIVKSDATNIQHTCRTAPGNSGGGLISPSGVLVGLINSDKDLLGEFGLLSLGLAAPAFYEKYKQLTTDENK